MAKQQSNRDPDLISRLWNNLVLSWHLMLDGRVNPLTKLIPVATLLYILSPIDLLPDLLLPFGVMDDVGALILGLQMFIRSAPTNIVAEYRDGARAIIREEKPRRGQANVIEGEYEVREREH